MKEFSKEVYLKWYEDMTMWRRFEDKCRSLYLKQKIRGFLHLYNGQEAIPAGFTHAMDLTKDSMITAYRCHIHPMAMGVDPKRIMAELCGKATGTSQGMGGSMHIFSKEHRFYGGHGIVGGQILWEQVLHLLINILIEKRLIFVLWEMVPFVKGLYMKHLIWQ